MPNFTVADEATHEFVANVMANLHGDLAAAGVTIQVLACHRGERDDLLTSPLKLHGYPCAATIKVTPVKQRVQGLADAVLTLSDPDWAHRTEPERAALVDHELTHLALARHPKTGSVRFDDHGRPRLKTRLHDWELGGFAKIARRHRDAAPEVQALRQALDDNPDLKQLCFAWGDDTAPHDPPPADLAAQLERVAATSPPKRGRKQKAGAAD